MSGSYGAGLLAARIASLTRADRPHAPDRRGEAERVPSVVGQALGRAKLLYRVPFRYLVPDPRLVPSLPQGTLRFFVVDDAWIDALLEGMFGGSRAGTREHALTRSAYPAARALAAEHAPFVRDVLRGRLTAGDAGQLARAGARRAPVGAVSGFLLRSELVRRWGAVQVRAWTTASIQEGVDAAEYAAAHKEHVVNLLRCDRLGSDTMLVLFDGLPEMFWFEEPHRELYFGVDAGVPMKVRDASGAETSAQVDVPMRSGPAPGVVDIAALAQALDQKLWLGAPRGSGAMAIQCVQPPVRQRFLTHARGEGGGR